MRDAVDSFPELLEVAITLTCSPILSFALRTAGGMHGPPVGRVFSQACMSEKVHATFAKASSVRLCAEEGKYKVSSKSGHKGKAPIGLMTFDEDEDPESGLAQSSDGEYECIS